MVECYINDVAELLRYKQPAIAITKHVCERHINTLRETTSVLPVVPCMPFSLSESTKQQFLTKFPKNIQITGVLPVVPLIPFSLPESIKQKETPNKISNTYANYRSTAKPSRYHKCSDWDFNTQAFMLP